MKETIIKCENCGIGEIKTIETLAGNVIKRGFTGKKGPQYYKGSIRFLTQNCPNCGAHHGQRVFNREKYMERLKLRGLPMVINDA